jgi:predicted nucleotidyltransferase
MMEPEAPGPVILRAIVGSTVHGLNVEDGVEDRDELAVCIESMDVAMGVHAPFEQLVYRTAAIREGKHDARSMAGDLDLTVYSLRKYVRLALKGNPTILVLLFGPTLVCDARGFQLREFAPDLISREAGKAFLGYLTAQKQRLLGERGQLRVHRPELVDAYGYDTKYAMHIIRLGLQGVELLKTGRMTLPMPEPERSRLRGIRTGSEDIQAALTWAGELENELRDLLTTSPLPPTPEPSRVEAWMLRMYLETWKCHEFNRTVRKATP